MFVIAGVTGNTGSVVADTLLAQKQPVRVIVRDAAKGAAWAAKGAQVAIAEFTDAAALTRALTGATAAYLLNPPNVTSETPLELNATISAALATAVREAKVPHVVHLSSIGAQHAAGTGPIRAVHVTERELAATGAAVTSLRAASFMENWASSLGMLGQGVLPSFIPADFVYPQVAARDIGRTAATALREGPAGAGHHIIELAGPRDYSATDIAAALSKLIGKPIAVNVAPLDAVVPTFTSFGISAPVAALFREMYAGVASGHIAHEGGAARAVRGTTTIDEVLRSLLKL